jgi:O-antigen ligase
MIALLVISVFSFDLDKNFPVSFNPALKSNIKKLLSHKAYLSLTIFFFLILVSGLWSEDTHYLLERLRIKLPFLLLPFAFISIPSFTERQFLSLFYFLIILMFFSALIVGTNYLLDFENITENINKGKVIPTPMHHIRYSLMQAFGILAGIVLWWKRFYLKYKWERYFIAFITVFLFYFIHVLSVRSGLFVLYLSILFFSIRYIYLTRRYKLGLATILGLILLPLIAYKTIESFRAKVDYARRDMKMYNLGLGKDYSDAERIISFEAGLKIGNKNPFFGVGAGDLKKEVESYYKEHFIDISTPKMPHNQLISTYAGTGLVGLFIFCFAFFYPLWYHDNYKDELFAAFHLIVFFSFMVENTIETAIGVAFYSFFLLLGINHLSGKELDSES